MTATEVVVFPDAVAVYTTYLAAAFVLVGDNETEVGARVSNAERQVTLRLVGAAEIVSRVIQRSTLRVEVRTGDGPLAQEEAQDLGQLTMALMCATEGTVQAGVTIYKVRPQGFIDDPDQFQKAGSARHVFDVAVSMRGNAL